MRQANQTSDVSVVVVPFIALDTEWFDMYSALGGMYNNNNTNNNQNKYESMDTSSYLSCTTCISPAAHTLIVIKCMI